MAFSNPTFVFVPGAWHPAQCFDLVRAQLEAQGFATEAVSTPSVGVPETGGLERPPGLDADVAAVRDVVSRLADEGRPIVLCVHSYGGLPGPSALGPALSTDGVNGDPSEKLGFKHRAATRKPGGVIMVVYLAAVVVPVGRSAYNELGEGYLPWMDVKVDTFTASDPVKYLYHDVPEELAAKAVQMIRTQSTQTFLDKATYEPWNDNVNCAYIFCDRDRAVVPAYQELAIDRLGPDAPVYHIDTAHSPFLNKPKELADILVESAKVGQARS